MTAKSTGHTTLPSGASTLGEAPREALLLAWLFPRTDGPIVELGPSSPRQVVLGRDEANDVVLNGEDVSRRHATIQRGPIALLNDLKSRNGTFVNGRRVTSAPLANHDVVRIGGWIGVVAEAIGPLGSLTPGLYGGAVLRRALAAAERAATSDLPVVLEGETGTGKEAVARAIHGWSGRTGPFVAVNCAALPEALAEGELFGYRRGAFTGADRANLGYFRAAQGGTLLLDEICDLPLTLQAKLLRVIEQREVHPLGEPSPVRLDVRLLAAAQESLEEAVKQGRFRADLFARLDGVTVRLPPLRERRAEIPYLFSRLVLDHAGGRPPAIDARLVERLCLYDWPFNVRELTLLVKKLLVLHGAEPALRVTHLPERMQPAPEGAPARAAPSAAPDPKAGAEVDAAALLAALRASGGNVARAAAALGISRQRAYRLMQGQPEVDLDALRRGSSEG